MDPIHHQCKKYHINKRIDNNLNIKHQKKTRIYYHIDIQWNLSNRCILELSSCPHADDIYTAAAAASYKQQTDTKTSDNTRNQNWGNNRINDWRCRNRNDACKYTDRYWAYQCLNKKAFSNSFPCQNKKRNINQKVNDTIHIFAAKIYDLSKQICKNLCNSDTSAAVKTIRNQKIVHTKCV